jgi:hypothetical protein
MCEILTDCLCGCKVDANFSDLFCVDYAIRGKDKPNSVKKQTQKTLPNMEIPKQMRSFEVEKYTRLNNAHKETYLVTRYDTILLDEMGVKMLMQILSGTLTEESLIRQNNKEVEENEVRRFISILEFVGVIKVVKEV